MTMYYIQQNFTAKLIVFNPLIHVCWSTVCNPNFKQQLVCKSDIMEFHFIFIIIIINIIIVIIIIALVNTYVFTYILMISLDI